MLLLLVLLLFLLQRGVGFWLRSPSTVRQLCELLLQDAVKAAAAEQQQQQQQGGLCLKGLAETSSPFKPASSSAAAGPHQAASSAAASAAAAGSAGDLVALWAAVSGKKGLIVASLKAQGNAKVSTIQQQKQK